MQEYMKPMEGHPSMVSSNAGVPDSDYGYVGFVKAALRSPTPEGLVSPEVTDPLHGLQFYHVNTPHRFAIDALSIDIIGRGERFGGQYDGWRPA